MICVYTLADIMHTCCCNSWIIEMGWVLKLKSEVTTLCNDAMIMWLSCDDNWLALFPGVRVSRDHTHLVNVYTLYHCIVEVFSDVVTFGL